MTLNRLIEELTAIKDGTLEVSQNSQSLQAVLECGKVHNAICVILQDIEKDGLTPIASEELIQQLTIICEYFKKFIDENVHNLWSIDRDEYNYQLNKFAAIVRQLESKKW